MEPNLVVITLAAVLGATGLGLIFVGTLMALLIALGNRYYIYGALIFIFFPVGLIFCARHREKASYAATLLYPGALLFMLFLGLIWWEVSRLGVDFLEIMATTKPVH